MSMNGEKDGNLILSPQVRMNATRKTKRASGRGDRKRRETDSTLYPPVKQSRRSTHSEVSFSRDKSKEK